MTKIHFIHFCSLPLTLPDKFQHAKSAERPSHDGTLRSFVSHTYGNLWTSRSQPRRPCYIYEAGHRAGGAHTRSLSVLWRVCVPSSTTATTTTQRDMDRQTDRQTHRRTLCVNCRRRAMHSTYLASGVLERDKLSVRCTVADGRRSLGTALVRSLGRHLSLHH